MKTFCRERAKLVCDLQSCLHYHRSGILVQHSKMDWALRRVVPERLCHRLLNLAQCPVLATHPGGARMYYTLRKEYYCLRMASNVFRTARNCQNCTALRGVHVKHKKLMKLFLAERHLEFAVMGVFSSTKKMRESIPSLWK